MHQLCFRGWMYSLSYRWFYLLNQWLMLRLKLTFDNHEQYCYKNWCTRVYDNLEVLLAIHLGEQWARPHGSCFFVCFLRNFHAVFNGCCILHSYWWSAAVPGLFRLAYNFSCFFVNSHPTILLIVIFMKMVTTTFHSLLMLTIFWCAYLLFKVCIYKYICVF